MKDSGNGGEGLGQTLAVLLQEVLGEPTVQPTLYQDLGKLCCAMGSRFTPTNLPVGAWAPSPYRI